MLDPSLALASAWRQLGIKQTLMTFCHRATNNQT